MTDCTVCAARRQAIADGTWGVHFRTCPHCGADWPFPVRSTSVAAPVPQWGTLVESGNPPCVGCGARLLSGMSFGLSAWWLWVDEVTGSPICGGDPGTSDNTHTPRPPSIEIKHLMDATP